MRPVEEHLAEVLGLVGPLPPARLGLADAHGCVLAEDVVADADLPHWDNSAMDGYAVRAADVAAASESDPVRLPVLGDIAAGDPGDRTVEPGQTQRIMTGAPLPPGADAVVPVEWTDGGTTSVLVRRPAPPGRHVRRRGEDVAAGETVLRAGARIGAAQVGLLAAVGRARVLARPRPRVLVLSTGSELVEPGRPLGPGQIHESNSFMLVAAATEAGASAERVDTVGDDPTRLLAVIEARLPGADLVVTTGGVSVGAYDVVKEVLGRLGTVAFHKVAMQPGMPQGLGTVGPAATPILTLPGNTVSAYVSFEVFARPAIRRLLGVEPVLRPTLTARCAGPFRSPPGKRTYARALLEVTDGGPVVSPAGGTGSHLVKDLAHSNALVVVPDAVQELAPGESASVLVLGGPAP